MTPKLNKALINARADIHNPAFDSINPHFRNKFASLRSVIAAVVPVMAEHGIAVVQDLQTVDGGVACYTHLYHDSGESMTFGPLVMRPGKNDPQGYASASTYARRYHLMAVGCVVGDEDDDGNSASESAFTGDEKSGARAAIIAALKDEPEVVVDVFSRLNNDQKAEIWHTFSRDQQKAIRAAKELIKEESE